MKETTMPILQQTKKRAEIYLGLIPREDKQIILCVKAKEEPRFKNLQRTNRAEPFTSGTFQFYTVIEADDIRIIGDIEAFTCRNAQLYDLFLSDCRSLKFLNCTLNNLAVLSLGECPNLEELYARGNSFSDVDTDCCPKLRYFDLRDKRDSKFNLSYSSKTFPKIKISLSRINRIFDENQEALIAIFDSLVSKSREKKRLEAKRVKAIFDFCFGLNALERLKIRSINSAFSSFFTEEHPKFKEYNLDKCKFLV